MKTKSASKIEFGPQHFSQSSIPPVDVEIARSFQKWWLLWFIGFALRRQRRFCLDGHIVAWDHHEERCWSDVVDHALIFEQ